ncbi:MAG: TonB-dependent receptor plug domain-containing protein, partial [Asticcacaulis sp.]
VLRGPLSTLWGSGALGGVISLATRQAQRPWEGDLSLEGFDHYGAARISLGGKANALNWRLYAGGQNDQGVSAFAGGTEKDGFAQTHLGGKISYNFGNTTLNALTDNTHSRNAYDGYPPPLYQFADTGDFGKTDTSLNAFSLNNRFTGGEQTLALNYTQTERHDFDPDAAPNFNVRGRMASADYHLLLNLAGSRWLAGAKYERDEMRIASPSAFDPHATPLLKSATLASLYGQFSHDFAGGASVAVSARHDQASSFGGEDIAQASVVIPAGQYLRLHASAGQGMKVPGLYQLYSDYGTPGLRPEKGLSVDGGADLSLDRIHLSATVFTRSVRDLIDFVFSCGASQPFGCYANIDRSKASGLELEGRADLTDTLHLRGNYSWLGTRNLSPGLEGLRLPHTPESMGMFDAAWDASPRLSLGASLRHAAESFDDTYNTRVLKAYSVADLRVSYRLSDGLSLYGRIENATDTQYQTAGGYGQTGRRVWLGIHSRLF